MIKTRRKFLTNVAQVAAGVGLVSIPASIFGSSIPELLNAKQKHSTFDTVRLGLIGCKNMGWSNLTSILKHAGVECSALCDVDSNILNNRAAELEKASGKKPKLFTDYRKLLEEKDIDAVIIGTPDHWHCLQMIHACEAGKDVYVEKPIANSIEECDLMVAAAKKYNSVVQVGQWQRSDPHWSSALEYLQSGKLGKIRIAKAWAYTDYGGDMPVVADTPVPKGVDYEMWLGPAPHRPFNQYRFHGSFRYFWDYAGGLMTDWGVHMIDMVLAGMNVSTPIAVSASGGKFGFPESAAETPDTMHAIYEFEGFTMVWEHSLATANGPFNFEPGKPGVAFTGNLGTLVINRDKWEVFPEFRDGRPLIDPLPVRKNSANGLDLHTLNFLECIKSRQKPNCTIEMGRNSAINAQMGNIAYKLGDRVAWNKKNNSFIGNSKADKLAGAQYQNSYKLPKI